MRHRTRSSGDAFAYGFFTVLGKWGHVLGQWQYHRDRRAGRNTRLIEYKSAAWPVTPTSPPISAAIPGGRS